MKRIISLIFVLSFIFTVSSMTVFAQPLTNEKNEDCFSLIDSLSYE